MIVTMEDQLIAHERQRTTCRTGLLIIGILAVLCLAGASCSRQPSYPQPTVSGADIAIDISTLRPEIPQFYTYRSKGKKTNFFVLRMHDKVLSFLDACVTCYPKRRGFEDRNGYVVCRACTMSFPIYHLEKGIGGCYPIKIEGRTEKGSYLIPAHTLEKASNRF